ncbi:MAG: hypothetical protein ACWGG5_05035 [Stenotrophomonas sp.]
MLNYKIRAGEIRKDMSDRVAANLDRADRAKLLLEYVNAVSSDATSLTRLDLPSLVEMEASLRAFASSHNKRPDSEVIGMRDADLESLRVIQEPLLQIEQRLDVLRVIARHGDA